MKKTVFFDFDGTLTRAPKIWSVCARRSLLESGIDVDTELVRRYTRRIYPWDRFYMDNRGLTGDNFWKYVENNFMRGFARMGIPQKNARKAAGLIRGHILNSGNYELFPDAMPALKLCREKGLPCHILSNNYPELEKVTEDLGIREYFGKIFVSGLMGYDKPRTEMFEIAAKETGGKPYIIGDNPIADIVGAKKAGFFTILVRKDDINNADFACGGLLEAVNRIIED